MLSCRDVSVQYGDLVALDRVDLDVAKGNIVCLLGPSGCGKTTLLRAIAGLERHAGTIHWAGRDLREVPPHRRGFGLMFQEYALFPHRDVFGNVAFGPRMQGSGTAEIARRVAECLELVGLPGYERRSVGLLSGGEQQRVALARALAPSPRLLLLDEPLGSLDRSLRQRLLLELRHIFTQLGTTAIYVTHDQEEALALGDRVVVMRAGRIEAEGSPEALWRQPGRESVARFLGFSNICDARIGDGRAETPWGTIAVGSDLPEGNRRVLIPPDAFRPDPVGPLTGLVEARSFRGDHVLLQLREGTAPTLEVAARWQPAPEMGQRVTLAVDPARVQVLADPPRGVTLGALADATPGDRLRLDVRQSERR